MKLVEIDKYIANYLKQQRLLLNRLSWLEEIIIKSDICPIGRVKFSKYVNSTKDLEQNEKEDTISKYKSQTPVTYYDINCYDQTLIATPKSIVSTEWVILFPYICVAVRATFQWQDAGFDPPGICPTKYSENTTSKLRIN